MGMARQTNKGKARHEDAKRIRQVSSKTQRREADLLGKARQGKASTAIPQLRTVHGSIWNCHTFVVPLYR